MKLLKIKKHHIFFTLFFIIFFSSLIISKKVIYYSSDQQLKQSLIKNNSIKEALFSTKHNITQTLIDLINHEQKSIKAAIYLLTDKNIALALIKAKKEKNIDIQIITCGSNISNKFNKIYWLQENNIDVYIFCSGRKKNKFNEALMHNKFFIFEKNIGDHCILMTGSFNCTITAQKQNKENMLVISDKYLCDLYTKEFEDIKNGTKIMKNYRHINTENETPKEMTFSDRFKKSFRVGLH